MSTPQEEIQRRIAEQDRRRRQNSNASPLRNQDALDAAEARNEGRFEAVQSLSPGRRALDSAEVRARRAAGEENPVGSAELNARERAQGLRQQNPGGAASFNVPQGAEVLSSSQGAQLTRTEPTTGRTIVRGDDGIERFQSTVIGGGAPQRGLRTGGGASNAGLINARLATGTGAQGEPVFDNQSIAEGVDDGTIPDPQVERRRIARNQAIDERNRPRTLRNEVAAGITSQEEANRQTLERNAQLEAATRASGNRDGGGSEGGGGDSAPIDLGSDDSLQAQKEVAQSFRTGEDARQFTDGEVRLFNAEARAARDAGDLPPDITPEQLGMLQAFTAEIPNLGDGILTTPPNEPIGPGMAFSLIQRAALNPGEDTIQIGSAKLDTSRLTGRAASAFQASVNRVRGNLNRSAAAEVLINGVDSGDISERAQETLNADLELQKQRQLELVNAQQPQLRRSSPDSNTVPNRFIGGSERAGRSVIRLPLNATVRRNLSQAGIQVQEGDTLRDVRQRIENQQVTPELADQFVDRTLTEEEQQQLSQRRSG